MTDSKTDLVVLAAKAIEDFVKNPNTAKVTAAPSIWPVGVPNDDAIGVMIFNTGPIPASASPGIWVVKNDTNRTICLTAARLWVGIDYNRIADCHAQLTRNDGSTLAVLQADHYSQSSAGAAVEMVYFPKPFVLSPGTPLALTAMANPFGQKFNAHFTCTVQGYYR